MKFLMSLFFWFTFAINLWHRKFVTADVTAMFVNNQKNSDMKKFICNQYGENTPCLSTKNVNICGRITRLEAIRMQYLAFSSISAEYLQKFEFLISQGIVATCLRSGGRCHMGFVANVMRFPAVQKL